MGASRIPIRLGIAALLVALVLPPAAPVAAADPSTSPVPSVAPSLIASPSVSPAPTVPPGPVPGDGGLTPGVLPGELVGPPFLKPKRTFEDLVAWRGGFAVIEWRSGRGLGRAAAVWSSPDGRAWTRAPLPLAMGTAVQLLPFKGGLVMTTDDRGEAGWGVVDLGFWRSADGVAWRRTGGVRYEVTDAMARRNCQANHQDVVGVDGALMLYVGVCWDPCCGFGPIPDAPAWAMLAPARAGGPARPINGVLAWRSTDAARWTQQPLKGLAPEDGSDFGFAPLPTQGGLFAWRDLGGQPESFHSADGIRWEPFGSMPADADPIGQAESFAVGDTVLLIGEALDVPLGPVGPPLFSWVIAADGTSPRSPFPDGYAHGVIEDGSTVLMIGASSGEGPTFAYEDDEAWAWIRGSRDGGRTWDDDLTWVGSDGSCLGEVAVNDAVAVMTACVEGEPEDVTPATRTPAFWVAPLPAPEVQEGIDASTAP